MTDIHPLSVLHKEVYNHNSSTRLCQCVVNANTKGTPLGETLESRPCRETFLGGQLIARADLVKETDCISIRQFFSVSKLMAASFSSVADWNQHTKPIWTSLGCS